MHFILKSLSHLNKMECKLIIEIMMRDCGQERESQRFGIEFEDGDRGSN